MKLQTDRDADAKNGQKEEREGWQNGEQEDIWTDGERESLLRATCCPLVSPAAEYLYDSLERERERENLKDIKRLSS